MWFNSPPPARPDLCRVTWPLNETLLRLLLLQIKKSIRDALTYLELEEETKCQDAKETTSEVNGIKVGDAMKWVIINDKITINCLKIIAGDGLVGLPVKERQIVRKHAV